VRAPAPPHRRRLAIVAVALAAALLAVALAVRALGGGDGPPPSDAAALVPDRTLAFVSLSTDGDRDAVERAAELASRFDAYGRGREALLRRLAGDGRDVDAERDVEPWLGDEAALALVDSGGSTAGSLVAIEVTDEGAARRFLERNRRPAVRKVYKGHETIRRGAVTTAFVRGFLVIGQDPTVQAAIDRARGGVPALAGAPAYRRATEGLPDDRVLTAYASADGLRRLLVPQGDVVGGLAVMLDQPALEAVGIAAQARGDERVRIVVRSALDAARQRSAPPPLRQFEPQLVEDVPKDALAYLGVSGAGGALQRLVVSAAGGTQRGGAVSRLLSRLAADLDERTAGGLRRDLLRLLDGELALVIQRRVPAPILSLVTRTGDEGGTRRTLDRLRGPLARLLRPRGEPEPRWDPLDLDGGDAWTLRLPSGAAITYAVADGRLVLSTSPDGVRAILAADGSLRGSDAFEEVLGGRPERVGTLGFLDFSQLLELGEQTGLNDSRAYLAARDDLRRVRAIGVSSTGDEGTSTAEILVSIR
jgi:hypothetical protein